MTPWAATRGAPRRPRRREGPPRRRRSRSPSSSSPHSPGGARDATQAADWVQRDLHTRVLTGDNRPVPPDRRSAAPRQIAPVVLVLAVTIAGFLGARQLGLRDARRESAQRAQVAAAQIRARLEQAASLADGLRRYMVGAAGGVSPEAFATNAGRWLSPAGFPAAAWVEQVSPARRAAYERRMGRP